MTNLNSCDFKKLAFESEKKRLQLSIEFKKIKKELEDTKRICGLLEMDINRMKREMLVIKGIDVRDLR